MSLAKTIIYDSADKLAQEIAQGAVLDELDEYGYTPLIQAAIVNSTKKAAVLLNAGAKVDFTDLTGRTALFWAADNGNLELCKLLLKHKANPNTYTLAGQSVLVNPLLKRHREVRKLLLENKADLNFAEDFINAKLVGHNFDLNGRVDVVDTDGTFIEMEFEGFYLRFTLDILINSLIDFKNNFAAKKLRSYFAELDLILHTLKVGSRLLYYQNYLLDVKSELNKINRLLNFEPLLLPVSFGGHATTLIKMWDYFIRCDRGAFGRKHGTVVIYQIPNGNKFNSSLSRKLLYTRQSQNYVNEGLIKELGLIEKWHLEVPEQISGNCAWANVAAVVPAMLFLLLLERYGVKEVDAAKKEAMAIYNIWENWNKRRSLDFCVQGFYSAETKARKASKAAILAALLFQSFKYGRAYDIEQAEKIVKILTMPDYNYILQSYIKVFSKDPRNILWQNLQNFLDDFGVDWRVKN